MAAPRELAARVTSRGLEINNQDLIDRLGGRKAYGRFLAALTVTEKPQPGRPKTYARVKRHAYRRVGEILIVPRVKMPLLLGRVIHEAAHDHDFAQAMRLGGGVREIPEEKWVPAQPFYPYQEAAANYLCNPGGQLSQAGGRGFAYMKMGTGMGKSRFAMAVAARGAGPVFVVVPTKPIREQWIDEFREVYPELTIGEYTNPPKGSRKVPPGPDTHDVVIGIINTVRLKETGFFKGYATLVLDEAHELHSPKNVAVLWLAQEVPHVLGLSATPNDRIDGLDHIVDHYLGRPIDAEVDIPDFDIADVNFRGIVREVEYAGNPEYCRTILSQAGTISAIETIGAMIRDPARMRLVAAEVERLIRLHETETEDQLVKFGLGPRPAAVASDKYPEGGIRTHAVFVFAEHRDYLPELREALLERFAPEDIEAPEIENGMPVVLRGGATRGDLDRAYRARIVLTTYGYSRRGVSIVDMTSIVLASPRRNGMRQILGRITRRGSDESIVRTVVDIKDVRTALKSQNSARRVVYKEKNYPIFTLRVDHEEYAEAGVAAKPTSAEVPVWEPEVDVDADNAEIKKLFDELVE